MRRVRAIEAVFFATGFSALVLQVTWQRLISLHAGVDLIASTTVVAAFMGGLGLGNLLGGVIADRSTPRRALALYAGSVALIGVYGLLTPVILYDGYRAMVPLLSGVFFHSAPLNDFSLVEERACVNAWVKKGDEQVLYLNATSQNGWPYDDFHVVIGIVPSLLHPNPKRALAVGLGAGSTAWGLLQDERLASVECVELCGGEIELIRRLAQSHGSTESRQILEDPRSKLVVADGRRALLTAKEPFDVITVDAMRPNGASAGNVYSLEFYQLVRDHLAQGGLFAQWIPTNRVLTTVKQVFPHVLSMEVPGGRGRFLIAANEQLTFDRERLRAELERRSSAFSTGQQASLAQFAASVEPKVERAGGAADPVAPNEINTDLFPRDEYFLNSN